MQRKRDGAKAQRSILLIELAILALLPFSSLAQEGSVCVTWVQPGGSIQEAIDLAKEGDTVCVAPGIYQEGSLEINKSISLIGQGSGPDETVILGGVETWDWGLGLGIEISSETSIHVHIENLTVSCSGLHVLLIRGQAQVNLVGVILEKGSLGHGLVVAESAKATATSCVFRDNRMCGVFVLQQGGLILTDCEVLANHFYGMLVVDSARVSVLSSHISENEGMAGMLLSGQPMLHLQNSTVNNNAGWGLLACMFDCALPGWLAEKLPEFFGAIEGSGNYVPGKSDTWGNRSGSLCPSFPGPPWPDLFLRK